MPSTSEPTHSDGRPMKTAFETRLAIIKKLAFASGVIGAILGVCASLAMLLYSEKRVPLKGVIMMPFIISGMMVFVVTGTALLFAPSSFFSSQQGREYLSLIGTQNVLIARIAIIIGLLFICAIVGLLTYGALQGFGIVDHGRRR